MTWDTIMRNYAGINTYSNKSDSIKKTWRQYFLYGMALHTATDVFAHSTYYKENGSYYRYQHPEADYKKTCPNSWKCAQTMAQNVAKRCKNKTAGVALDFSSYGNDFWSGFYLGNVLSYAVATNENNKAQFELHFKKINYTIAN